MSTIELISEAIKSHNLRMATLKAYRTLDRARRNYYIITEGITNANVLETHLKVFTVLESRIRSEIKEMNNENMKAKLELIKSLAATYVNS